MCNFNTFDANLERLRSQYQDTILKCHERDAWGFRIYASPLTSVDSLIATLEAHDARRVELVKQLKSAVEAERVRNEKIAKFLGGV